MSLQVFSQEKIYQVRTEMRQEFSSKTVFSPNIMPPKQVEQDQIDVKWLEKVSFLT